MGVKEFFNKAKEIRNDATAISVDLNDYNGETMWEFWIHYGEHGGKRECVHANSPEKALERLSATVEETTAPDEMHIELEVANV